MIELKIPDTENVKLGNDLIHVPTFKESLNDSFIRRVYTEAEKEYCQQFNEPLLRYASTFAAKEAVYKAVKQWDEHLLLPWKKISISRNKLAGMPIVELYGEQYEKFSFSLSISHDGDYVWGVVICTINR